MVERSVSSWVGWVYFAGALLLLDGGMQIVAGLTGIFNGNFYAHYNGQLLVFNYATWGWINLLLGVLVLLTGLGLFAGRAWAQVVAVILVVLAAVGHFAFLSVYPVQSIILLIIDGLIVYALTMHGGEVGVKQGRK